MVAEKTFYNYNLPLFPLTNLRRLQKILFIIMMVAENTFCNYNGCRKHSRLHKTTLQNMGEKDYVNRLQKMRLK